MGMAASQCRLLTLTARLSDLEYQAQSISNSKIRLSQSSEAVATEYAEALDKKKLTVLSGYNSQAGAMNYIDATARNLTTYNAVSTLDKQRFLKDSSGRVIISQDLYAKYNAAKAQTQNLHNQWGNDEGHFIEVLCNSHNPPITADSPEYAKYKAYYHSEWTGEEWMLRNLGYTSNPNYENGGAGGLTYCEQGKGASAYYTNVFNEIKENGYNVQSNDNMNSEEWLYSQLQGGNITLSEWDQTAKNGAGDFVNVSWSSGDTTLKAEVDDADIARAEAKYQVKMAQIESKDKRYDLDLKNIDTEHTAIQTEMDSVKKVIDKNIERSFKTFNS